MPQHQTSVLQCRSFYVSWSGISRSCEQPSFHKTADAAISLSGRLTVVPIMISALLLAGCSTSNQNRISNVAASGFGAHIQARKCDFHQNDLVGRQFQRWGFGSRVLRVPRRVEAAIRRASQITGVSADYLALTAARESGFKVSARAATSTATGLFQFVEPTWLALVAADGNCLGLSSLVRHIDRDSRGGLRVGSPPVLRMILDLRKNPELSSILAARLAQRNARVFRTHRGRQPTYAELYISHFLGAGNAAELSALAARVPETRADRRFKSAARSNAAIFYDGWRPRTFREVYHILIRGHIGWQVVYS